MPSRRPARALARLCVASVLLLHALADEPTADPDSSPPPEPPPDAPEQPPDAPAEGSEEASAESPSGQQPEPIPNPYGLTDFYGRQLNESFPDLHRRCDYSLREMLEREVHAGDAPLYIDPLEGVKLAPYNETDGVRIVYFFGVGGRASAPDVLQRLLYALYSPVPNTASAHPTPSPTRRRLRPPCRERSRPARLSGAPLHHPHRRKSGAGGAWHTPRPRRERPRRPPRARHMPPQVLYKTAALANKHPNIAMLHTRRLVQWGMFSMVAIALDAMVTPPSLLHGPSLVAPPGESLCVPQPSPRLSAYFIAGVGGQRRAHLRLLHSAFRRRHGAAHRRRGPGLPVQE